MVVEGHEALTEMAALDPALWAAPSAPVADLGLDPVLAKWLSPEADGRLSMPRLNEATGWLFARIGRRSVVSEKPEGLALDDFDSSSSAGAALRAQAEALLRNAGAGDGRTVSLAQVRARRKALADLGADGDGRVELRRITDPAAAELAGLAVAGLPEAERASGLSRAALDRFLPVPELFRNWQARPSKEPELLPLGEATAGASRIAAGLAARIEEWFLLADLMAQEGPDPGEAGRRGEARSQAQAAGPAAITDYLAKSPLAAVRADGRLPLDDVAYPAHREALSGFRREVVDRLLPAGTTHLDRAGWATVNQALAPYRAWVAARPAGIPDPAPALVGDPEALAKAAAELNRLLDFDAAASGELAGLAELEIALLLVGSLLDLARCMVSFAEIYLPDGRALFEDGTLVLDGRRLELAIRVRDRERHKKIAIESRIFLVYATVLDRQQKPRYEVVAPVTAGERGRLRVGKRGLYLDRAGATWDAEVIEVMENPISLMEAAKAPFRRLSEMISQKLESLASNKLASGEKALTELPSAIPAAPASAAAAPGAPAPAAPAPAAAAAAPAPAGGGLQNMMLAGSLATAALGSAAAFVLKAVAEINLFRLATTLVGLVALVAGISAFLGWLKLRRRDLSLLLEANQWAVNSAMPLDRRMGAGFTRIPEVPGEEPAPPPSRRWIFWLVLLVLTALAWSTFLQAVARAFSTGTPAP